jgi:hypothetical protein
LAAELYPKAVFCISTSADAKASGNTSAHRGLLATIVQIAQIACRTKKINAQGWKFLNQSFQFPPTANAICPERIDPAMWQKRAEEARSLVDTMRNAEAKRSILEIAESYEAIASSLENSNIER